MEHTEVQPPLLRPARPTDCAQIAMIYAHHVHHGLGTFDEVAPSEQHFVGRLQAVSARGLPWWVATAPDSVQVLGFAYAAPFRERSAYRFTAEDSVYIAPGSERLGLGRALLQRVIEASTAHGLRRLVALIGDRNNHASIALHRACGFREAGVLREVGFKHEQWVDVVLMQRDLVPGSPA